LAICQHPLLHFTLTLYTGNKFAMLGYWEHISMLLGIVRDKGWWKREDLNSFRFDFGCYWTLSGLFPGPPHSISFIKIFEFFVRVPTAARPPVPRRLIKSREVHLDYSNVVPLELVEGF
jgi:hypothetical protein